MKRLTSIAAIAAGILSITACGNNSSENFTDRLEKFINDSEKEISDFTEENWKKAEKEFNKFVEYFNENADKFTDEQKDVYTTIGGTPFLDGAYTVYGEVTEGMDVVDKIQSVATDSNDRPVDDVKIIKAILVDD